jgi:PHD/YefM family antitoxin component YafN of YafNO toxin-antitoxin module
MIKLKPEIIHHNGKPQFAVIPYADFLSLQEELEDAACLRILRKAKAKESDAPTVSMSVLKSKIGITPRQRSRRSTSAT